MYFNLFINIYIFFHILFLFYFFELLIGMFSIDVATTSFSRENYILMGVIIPGNEVTISPFTKLSDNLVCWPNEGVWP